MEERLQDYLCSNKMKTRRIYKSKQKGSKTRIQKAGAMPTFSGLRILASGMEGIAYKTPNSKVLKIPKSGNLNPQEIIVQQKLASLGLPYFPTLYESNHLQNNRSYKNISEMYFNKKETYTFGTDTGPYTYKYVLMEYIEGTDIHTYIYNKYSTLFFRTPYLRTINTPDEQITPSKEIFNTLKKEFINIFSKILFALYIAQKVFNYRHNDLHTGNCIIKPDGTPVIIDFGFNRIATNSKKNLKYSTSSDIDTFISYSLAAGLYDFNFYRFIQNLHDITFAKFQNDIGLTTIEKRVEDLLQVKYNSKFIFNYETSFNLLNIPNALIQHGKQLIEHRNAIPNTEETYLQEKTNALQMILFRIKKMGGEITDDLIQSIKDYVEKHYDPLTNDDITVTDKYMKSYLNNNKNNNPEFINPTPLEKLPDSFGTQPINSFKTKEKIKLNYKNKYSWMNLLPPPQNLSFTKTGLKQDIYSLNNPYHNIAAEYR